MEGIEKAYADLLSQADTNVPSFAFRNKTNLSVQDKACRREWFICSPSRSFALLDDLVIHGHSCAAEVGPRKLKSRDSKIDAGFWLEGFRYNHKAQITEDSRYFPTLNKTLTLLWIHDEI